MSYHGQGMDTGIGPAGTVHNRRAAGHHGNFLLDNALNGRLPELLPLPAAVVGAIIGENEFYCSALVGH